MLDGWVGVDGRVAKAGIPRAGGSDRVAGAHAAGVCGPASS